MSNDIVTTSLFMDTEQAFAQIAELQAAVNKTDAEWQQKKKQIYAQVEEALTRVNRLIHLFRMVLRTMRVSIDPVSDAVLSTTSAIISYMIALKAAYAVSGPWGWVMVVATAFAFAMVLIEQAKIWKELAEAKSASARAEALANKIDPMSFSWRTG